MLTGGKDFDFLVKNPGAGGSWMKISQVHVAH
jgi:hypothetical protein